MKITHAPSDAFCLCGLLVAFEFSEERIGPVAHRAPLCDRVCAGGGVDRPVYLLGNVHRSPRCRACSEEHDE